MAAVLAWILCMLGPTHQQQHVANWTKVPVPGPQRASIPLSKCAGSSSLMWESGLLSTHVMHEVCKMKPARQIWPILMCTACPAANLDLTKSGQFWCVQLVYETKPARQISPILMCTLHVTMLAPSRQRLMPLCKPALHAEAVCAYASILLSFQGERGQGPRRALERKPCLGKWRRGW